MKYPTKLFESQKTSINIHEIHKNECIRISCPLKFQNDRSGSRITRKKIVATYETHEVAGQDVGAADDRSLVSHVLREVGLDPLLVLVELGTGKTKKKKQFYKYSWCLSS